MPAEDLLAAMKPKPMRLLFLLPKGTNRFLSMLGQLIAHSEARLAPFNVRCQVDYIKSFNPELLARRLWHHRDKVDGIAFMALEHPAVRETVNMLAERGVPTVTLISDILNARRAAYVGLDNRSRGTNRRLSDRAVYRAAAGQGGDDRGQPELSRPRRARNGLSASVRGIVSRRSRSSACAKAMTTPTGITVRPRMLLGQHPDLAGIYNIGGAADGVARALKEMDRARDVVFIGHGLTSDTRSLVDRRHDGRGHHPESAEHDDELHRDLQQSAGRQKRHARY